MGNIIINGALSGITPATGVSAFLETPSSANLRAALTDETGTGALVFAGGALDAATATTQQWYVSNTTVATTAFAHAAFDVVERGSHSSPLTTNPLAVTDSSPMCIVWYGATGTINLRSASGLIAGKGYLIYNTGSFTITINPDGSDVIVRDGVVQTGGVSMTLSSGAGNYVYIISDGVRWITLWYKGTLAEGT